MEEQEGYRPSHFLFAAVAVSFDVVAVAAAGDDDAVADDDVFVVAAVLAAVVVDAAAAAAPWPPFEGRWLRPQLESFPPASAWWATDEPWKIRGRWSSGKMKNDIFNARKEIENESVQKIILKFEEILVAKGTVHFTYYVRSYVERQIHFLQCE